MKHLRTALENRLELIGGIAAVAACAAILWAVGQAELRQDVNQLYIIENGKWMKYTQHRSGN